MNSTQVLDLVVEKRTDETPDILSVELAHPDGSTLPPFKAGAHVDVYIDAGLVRQYSICSAPSRPDRYRLGILRTSDSRGGSEKLHTDLKTGATVRIGYPRNAFALEENDEPAILIGGGIGITPLISMAYHLHEIGADFELHYCAKSQNQAAFLDELSCCAFKQRVFFHFDDGAPAQRLDLQQIANESKSHVYLCGPGGFMDWVQATLVETGYPSSRVHLERFSAAPSTPGERFTVVAFRSGVKVEVTETQSIAEALSAAGVCVPLSCEQGVCGTCLTRVIDGTPEHRDLYQTDAEREANTHVALCCSRSASACLTVDI